MSLFYVDPIEALLRIVARRWPHIDARVQYDDEIESLGLTSFPPHGECGPAIVSLRPDLAGITGTIDILAHELAHVVTGTSHEDDHGSEWERAYDQIHEDFCALDGYFPIRSIAMTAEGRWARG